MRHPDQVVYFPEEGKLKCTRCGFSCNKEDFPDFRDAVDAMYVHQFNAHHVIMLRPRVPTPGQEFELRNKYGENKEPKQ